MNPDDRRMIEHEIPLAAVNYASSKEKKHPRRHVELIHQWPARRPRSACRVAIAAALLRVPKTQKEIDERLQLLTDLAPYECSRDALQRARKLILDENGGVPPKVLDLFAGGGAIPLEAANLGCEAHAVELNPVAHIIELATCVYPQRYGAKLADLVEKWGKWVLDRVRVEIGDLYAGIERDETNIEKDGIVWYRDLPDEFVCKCGKMRVDLRIARRNLHGFLGGVAVTLPVGMLDLTALNRNAAMRTMCVEFFTLLQADPKEEQVHKFINENRLVLHHFAPMRVWSKPPITTRFKADFAILSAGHELLLVELERSNLRLLKKDGGMSAELQTPFDQVRSWLHAADDNRAGVLDGLGLRNEQVTKISGVVLAGRNMTQNAEHLRNLMRTDHGVIRLLTYDDLLIALHVLTESIAGTEPVVGHDADDARMP